MTPIDASAVAELVKQLRFLSGVLHTSHRATLGSAATLLEQQAVRIAELDFLNAGLSCMAERNEDADKKYEARLQELEALLVRSRVFVAYDAQMMADITRFSPLEAASQALHDSTETESEKLLPLIDVALAADAGKETQP